MGLEAQNARMAVAVEARMVVSRLLGVCACQKCLAGVQSEHDGGIICSLRFAGPRDRPGNSGTHGRWHQNGGRVSIA